MTFDIHSSFPGLMAGYPNTADVKMVPWTDVASAAAEGRLGTEASGGFGSEIFYMDHSDPRHVRKVFVTTPTAIRTFAHRPVAKRKLPFVALEQPHLEGCFIRAGAAHLASPDLQHTPYDMLVRHATFPDKPTGLLSRFLELTTRPKAAAVPAADAVVRMLAPRNEYWQRELEFGPKILEKVELVRAKIAENIVKAEANPKHKFNLPICTVFEILGFDWEPPWYGGSGSCAYLRERAVERFYILMDKLGWSITDDIREMLFRGLLADYVNSGDFGLESTYEAIQVAFSMAFDHQMHPEFANQSFLPPADYGMIRRNFYSSEPVTKWPADAHWDKQRYEAYLSMLGTP